MSCGLGVRSVLAVKVLLGYIPNYVYEMEEFGVTIVSPNHWLVTQRMNMR